MDKTKERAVKQRTSGVPITVQEYAKQYNVCPKTVEKWFKHGKKVLTIKLAASDLRN